MQKKTLFNVMWLIAFAFFNLVLFMVAGFVDHTATFWITYVFAVIAFGIVKASVYILGKSGMHIRDWLFGYPIIRHCIIYCVLEVVGAIVFFVLEDVIAWQIAFLVQVTLLALYSFLAISCLISKKTIDEVHTKVERKTQTMQLLRVDAEMLVRKCTDPDAKKVFEAFSEKLRYSDPVSHDAVVYLENRLKTMIAEAGEKLANGEITEAMDICRAAEDALAERNMKVKVYKGK